MDMDFKAGDRVEWVDHTIRDGEAGDFDIGAGAGTVISVHPDESDGRNYYVRVRRGSRDMNIWPLNVHMRLLREKEKVMGFKVGDKVKWPAHKALDAGEGEVVYVEANPSFSANYRVQKAGSTRYVWPDNNMLTAVDAEESESPKESIVLTAGGLSAEDIGLKILVPMKAGHSIIGTLKMVRHEKNSSIVTFAETGGSHEVDVEGEINYV